MGRKQKLKLQRKIEKRQGDIIKKEKKKKRIIFVIFLAVFIFAAFQVNVALNNNKNIQEDSTDMSDYVISKVATIETNRGDIKLELFS